MGNFILKNNRRCCQCVWLRRLLFYKIKFPIFFEINFFLQGPYFFHTYHIAETWTCHSCYSYLVKPRIVLQVASIASALPYLSNEYHFYMICLYIRYFESHFRRKLVLICCFRHFHLQAHGCKADVGVTSTSKVFA